MDNEGSVYYGNDDSVSWWIYGQWNIRKFEREEIRRILGQDFIVRLLKNRLRDGQNVMILKIVSIYDVRLNSELKIKEFTRNDRRMAGFHY